MTLRFGRWRFAPGPWPTLATLVLLALTISLGNWQRERARVKLGMQQRYDAAAAQPPVQVDGGQFDADAVRYRRLVVRGRFDDAHTILLDNRVHRGVAGYHVLTPLRPVGGGHALLVNRGWLAPGKTRAAVTPPPTPGGVLAIEGIAADPQGRYLELGDTTPQGRIWQNLDFGRYARQSGLALQPVLLLQTSNTADGLERDWPRPDTGVDMHRGYALQWYGLAGTLGVLWLVLNLERTERTASGKEVVA